MNMSKGRVVRCVAGLAVAGAAMLASGAAFAELGQPSPWEWTLQPSGSPVMDNIHWFHNVLLTIITIITLFVLGLLIAVMVKFNARANPVPSRTTHNTLIEVAWTLIPVLILVSIAVPSFRLLFLQLDLPKADITVITLFVLALLITVMVKFNARANPTPSRTTLFTGTTISLSTVRRRGSVHFLRVSLQAKSESNSNLPLSG